MTIAGNDGLSARRLNGVMILHGFTANLDSVRPLFDAVRGAGLDLVAPLLRGHGQPSPDALRGVTWHDWIEDVERALIDAAGTQGKMLVLGHSMGALLALQLAARHPTLVDSVILATPPLRLASPLAPGRPLHFLAPLVSLVVDRWAMHPCFADPANAIIPEQYGWAPTRTIMSMFDLLEATIPLMSKVCVPALILHGRHESIVMPESAELLHQAIGTPAEEKQLVWFEKTDHQIFCDCEREQAIGSVSGFIARRAEIASATQAS